MTFVVGRSRGTGPRATMSSFKVICSLRGTGPRATVSSFKIVGRSRGTGPRATVTGRFLHNRGGQAPALR